MKLCDNCLEHGPDVTAVEVGDLCPECAGALTGGRWDLIHERYTAEREVRRG